MTTTQPTATPNKEDEELARKIRDITKVMLIALSEWQAGAPVDYYSAKVKGRQELFDLMQSHTTSQLKAQLDRLEEQSVYGEYDKSDDESYQGDVIPRSAIRKEREQL
jgi:hypothetical protein